MPLLTHPDLLVGTSTGDDAAVWRVSEDRAFVATVDFFTPIVDDARVWGAIAAANSASDVYAMGGRPLFALNVAAWPREQLDLDLLGDVLEGASAVAARGGWMIVGGHTVDGPEPMFGQTVIGEVHPDQIMTNDAARVGEVLLLTKPIGTGIVATAVKRLEPVDMEDGGALAIAYPAAVASMTTLNDVASRVAVALGVRAATDVTGFGLLGHLHKMALGSGVSVELHAGAVPLLPDVDRLRADGFVPGGTARNVEFVTPYLDVADSLWDRYRDLLADPQTSGGLLLSVAPERVSAAVLALVAEGQTAAIVGSFLSGPPGRIVIR